MKYYSSGMMSFLISMLFFVFLILNICQPLLVYALLTSAKHLKQPIFSIVVLPKCFFSRALSTSLSMLSGRLQSKVNWSDSNPQNVAVAMFSNFGTFDVDVLENTTRLKQPTHLKKVEFECWCWLLTLYNGPKIAIVLICSWGVVSR